MHAPQTQPKDYRVSYSISHSWYKSIALRPPQARNCGDFVPKKVEARCALRMHPRVACAPMPGHNTLRRLSSNLTSQKLPITLHTNCSDMS